MRWTAALAWLLLTPVSMAHSPEPPQTFHGSASKARKQHCATRLTIHADGRWSAHTTFTNRRRLDSDRFVAVFRLVDGFGDAVVAIKHSARVHGRLALRSANRAYVSSGGRLPEHTVPLHDVRVRYVCTGRGGVPDGDIVGRLIEVIRKL